MQYGWVLPYGDARTAAELAVVAEQAGWDAFFVWEGVWALDAWTLLTAAAMRTERIALGTMLTPVPRRRPWELASQVATLDNLAGGRVILPVGLGASDDRWWLFEDDPGVRVRAELLDEGLELLVNLWRTDPEPYAGRHYRMRLPERMVPPSPVQTPRPPIWVVGAWPRPRSMRRAARWDGWLPTYVPKGVTGHSELTPEHVREGIAWIAERRAEQGLGMDGFAVPAEGTTPPGPEGAELVRSWREAGANWWIEADWSEMDPARVREAALRRLTAGPPRDG